MKKISDIKYGAKPSQILDVYIPECTEFPVFVYFPKGIYVLATVFLKSNVHIKFEDGTDILGCLDFYTYAQQETITYPIYQDQSHTYFDLAIYFAGCNNVNIHDVKMRVYIDGISPDNCKNVNIYNCDIESGDDGIVFKSSYTLNRLDVCKNIKVWDCRVKSRCSAIKFGTETNGGFEDINIENINIYDTRITGIAIESVDGAIIDNISLKNIKMKNTNGLLFIHLGKRMRGPAGREIGEIRNITLENITAEGPYEPYICIPANYFDYKANDYLQYPWIYSSLDNTDEKLKITGRNTPWQLSSNVCGLKDKPLKNISLNNVRFKVWGGVTEYEKNVSESADDYPEIMVYGWTLPAKGIYFRHIDGLSLNNVTVESYNADAREDFVFENVEFK